MVLAKIFERTISREQFRKSISSRRTFSAKFFREIMHLPRELVTQGNFGDFRIASTLKTEKDR